VRTGAKGDGNVFDKRENAKPRKNKQQKLASAGYKYEEDGGDVSSHVFLRVTRAWVNYYCLNNFCDLR
jgi:hypothetical protein